MSSRLKSLSSSSSRGHVRFIEVGPGNTSFPGLQHSSSDSDDHDDTDSEAEDLEASLSRQYGEAAEAPATAAGAGGTKKRGADDINEEDIANRYEKAAKKKKQRPKRPELTERHLTGPEGLIRIPREFPAVLRYTAIPTSSSSSGRSKSRAAAASYALSLVEAYKSFCYTLCPPMAFEDTLLKIERLGSKREVKAYLEQMRQDVRNQHVEKVLGKEKAERILQQLHDALQQQHQQLQHQAPDDAPPVDGATVGASAAGGGARVPPAAPPNEEEEPEAAFDDLATGTVLAPAGAMAPRGPRPDGLSADAPIVANALETQAAVPNDASMATPTTDAPLSPRVGAPARMNHFLKNRLDGESDDEDEFLFEEQPTLPGTSHAASRRRRLAVEDDDDDGEDIADPDEVTTEVAEARQEDVEVKDPPNSNNDGVPFPEPTSLLESEGRTTSGTSAATDAPRPPPAVEVESSAFSGALLHPSSSSSPAPSAVERQTESRGSVGDSPSAADTPPSPPLPLAQESPDHREPSDLDESDHRALASPRVRVAATQGNDDDASEVATIVPTSLTAPTQWDDDDEDHDRNSFSAPKGSPEESMSTAL